jgi:microcystin degradation protein MlrC
MKRVLLAQIMHETNTFSILPTDEEAYRRRYLVTGGTILSQFKDTSTELGGFIDAAAEYGWTPIPAIAANATPSGKVTAQTWAMLQDAVFEAIDKHRPIDGICLAMHGAMVTETDDDAEGALLGRLRERLGRDIPIALTLDLHANVGDAMAEHADFIIAFHTYPHIDHYERGREAARLVEAAMKGEIVSVCKVGRVPTLDGCDHGRTQSGPMVELERRAREYEQEPGIHVVSVQAGFGWSDVAFTGPSVVVSHDPKASARADEILDDMLGYIWETRREASVRHVPLDEAIAEMKRSAPGDKPLVVADATDNPGAGGYADTTNLLRAMIGAGIENAAFCSILDNAAVMKGREAGVGATISVDLGGHTDPQYGAPIEVEGVVRHLSDGDFVHDGPMWKGVAISMGPTMVLGIGGIDVIVCTNRMQTTDLQAFLSQGIDPRERAVVVVKSSHHFRAAFEPISRKVIVVDSGSLCSHDLTRFSYEKLRRPIWPLDEMPEEIDLRAS